MTPGGLAPIFNRMVEYAPRIQDDLFIALADATRRDILDRLARGRSRVTEIASAYPVSLNAISKHLKVLERAGLVRREVTGREHWCSLDPAPLRDLADWAHHYEAFWNARVDALEQSLARRRRKP